MTDQQSGINPPPKPEAPKPAATATVQAPVISTTASTDTGSVEKSALYKISPDNTVETLWSSKEENIYDVALEGESLLLLRMRRAESTGLSPEPTAAKHAGGANQRRRRHAADSDVAGLCSRRRATWGS